MAGIAQHIRFTKRAIPIPPDYRPLYKIGHILIILAISSRAGKSSLMRLHFLCWPSRVKEILKQLGNG